MNAAAEPFDVVILGGGTAGCVLAARLSEEEGRRVCLVEAGPDYGAFDAGAWPEEMLDPTTPPSTHDWESGAELSLARARVIGGCSSHNACFVVHAHPSDYDAWGVPGWDQAGLDPHLRAAERAIHARPPAPGEVGPWSRAVVEAAGASGIEVLDDFNRPVPGAGVLPLNVERGARWNTAFAYLDGARNRENLTVLDRAVVDRVLIEDGQAVGAAIQRDGTGAELTGGTVIVAAGAYGSPLILLRSGIGPAEHLGDRGVGVVADVPGVGANLQDHFGVIVMFRATDALQEELARESRDGPMTASGSIVKAATSGCPDGEWDLHLVSWAALDTQEITGKDWRVQLSPYLMNPASRGSVRLRDGDPASHPDVNLGYASDPAGADRAAIVEGIAITRRIVAAGPLAELIEAEVLPGPDVHDLHAFAEENVRGYFHPVGTCAMGTDPATAVVDAECRVRGVAGLSVCDASVMPVIPRANTNLITIAIAERIAAQMS